jgi:hypothetical protein
MTCSTSPPFGSLKFDREEILDDLGLSTPEADKPPPPVREMLRVAEHGWGWCVPLEWD